jgi:hypothetical protein
MSSKKTSISNGETKNHLPPIPARVSGELGGGGKNGDYVEFLLVGNGGCARGVQFGTTRIHAETLHLGRS